MLSSSGGDVNSLRTYLSELLDRQSLSAEFAAAIRSVLAVPGRPLSEGGTSRWAALVFETCRAFGGDASVAVPLAASAELLFAAADIVDNLADREWDDGFLESGRALNLSLALLSLAHNCCITVSATLGPERAVEASRLLSGRLFAACDGEDRDLVFEKHPWVTEEQAYAMTCRKSGSLGALACQLGAVAATTSSQVSAGIGKFGWHLGTISQLLNDIGDVKPGRSVRSSDIALKKKTLPIAYALTCAKQEDLNELRAWTESSRELTDDEIQTVARAIDDLGALHYTRVIVQFHQERALATIDKLRTFCDNLNTPALIALIPELDARPVEAE